MKKIQQRFIFIAVLLLLSFSFVTNSNTVKASSEINTPAIGTIDIGAENWKLLNDERTIAISDYKKLSFIDGKNMTVLNTIPLNFNVLEILQKDNDTLLLLSFDGPYEYSMSTGSLILIKDYEEAVSHSGLTIWEKIDDNHFLEISSNRFSVRSFDGYEVLHRHQVNSNIKDHSYDPHTKTLALVLNNNELLFYDLNTFDYSGHIKNEEGFTFQEVIFSNDGKTIYTIQKYSDSYYASIIAFDYKTKKQLYKKDLNQSLYNATLINDRFIQAQSDKSFHIFDLNTRSIIHSFYWYGIGLKSQAALYLDSFNRIVTVPNNSSIIFFDLTELNEIPEITNVNVYTSEDTLYTGGKYTLNGFLEFSDGSQKEFQPGDLNWHVSDFYTAHFKDGILTARDPGTFTMTSRLWNFDLSLTKTVHSFIPEDADRYIEWPASEPVSPKKVWEVLVNQSVNYENIQENDIMVTDRKGKLIPILYVLDEKNGRTSIKVVPTLPYKKGETYTLWVRHLVSDKGNPLGDNVKMTFSVQ